MTVTATAKAMVVRSTKDDKADMMHDLMGTMHRTDGIGTMARAWHMCDVVPADTCSVGHFAAE